MGVENKARSSLQTVDRALDILLSFHDGRHEWGVTELARELNINVSTSQRLLSTLASKGFLYADPDTRRYRMGPALWRLSMIWESTGGLASITQDVLDDLARQTGRTAQFSVPEGFYIKCIAAADGINGPLRVHPLVGELYPAHAGATSRAYFAFLDPTTKRTLLHGRQFWKFSDLTEVDADRLEEIWDQTQARGWAFSQGEYDGSTRAVSVPVIADTNPIGSLSLIESKHQLLSGALEDYVPLLRHASAQISHRLYATSKSQRKAKS